MKPCVNQALVHLREEEELVASSHWRWSFITTGVYENLMNR